MPSWRQSQNPNTKFFALQVLDAVIKYRWNALPDDQREGIKNFISNLIIKLSTDDASFRGQRAFISKINSVLVQILKHDWPRGGRSFIPDLVGAAKQSESLCENCMNILKLLSEEVFDFSRGELTQAKIMELKNALNTDFPQIHELVRIRADALAEAGADPDDAADAARVLCRGSRSGTSSSRTLLDTLLELSPNPEFRNVAIQCLGGDWRLGG